MIWIVSGSFILQNDIRRQHIGLHRTIYFLHWGAEALFALADVGAPLLTDLVAMEEVGVSIWCFFAVTYAILPSTQCNCRWSEQKWVKGLCRRICFEWLAESLDVEGLTLVITSGAASSPKSSAVCALEFSVLHSAHGKFSRHEEY